MSCILHIETSTDVCSVAVSQDGACIFNRESEATVGSSQMTPGFIEEALSFIDCNLLTLDAVAVSCGPGSYTGLRIGVSTAKGICYGRDTKLIAVPTLQLMCVPVLLREAVQEEDALLCPMIDARRMEVYTALYSCCGEKLHAETDIQALIVDTPDALPDRPMVYFGDGAEKCQSVLENEHRHYLAGIVPEAQYISPLGKWLRTKEEIAYYEPFYLKEFVAAPSHVKGLK